MFRACPQGWAELHFHLGPSTQHTVHEAELVGILLGLHLIKTDKKGQMSYSLGIDNQAAISALNAVKSSPGQYIADDILAATMQIKKSRNSPNYSLTFRWTAGHSGITGNEEVDGEAKKATEGLTSDTKLLPPLLRKPLKMNKLALRQRKKESLKTRWKKEWSVSERAPRINALDPSLPSNKYLELINDDRLSCMDASRIFQMRTGHIPLNGYLKRFKRVDSAKCPACGHPKENVRHFLLECPSYAHERWALVKQCKKKSPKLEDILNDKDLIVPIANYIHATGRFEQGNKKRTEAEGR